MPKATDVARHSAGGRDYINAEVAQLRDLGLDALRGRWKLVFRREAPSHLQRHLLFSMLAYRLQAEVLGDLGAEMERYLARLERASSPAAAAPLTQAFEQRQRKLAPGTVLTREWNGQHHRVMVRDDGFAWDGRTYRSLSEIAKTITGTKWNGPRFFGLRDRKQPEAAE
jgi:hypothetical protein